MLSVCRLVFLWHRSGCLCAEEVRSVEEPAGGPVINSLGLPCRGALGLGLKPCPARWAQHIPNTGHQHQQLLYRSRPAPFFRNQAAGHILPLNKLNLMSAFLSVMALWTVALNICLYQPLQWACHRSSGTTQDGGRSDAWDEVLFKVLASGHFGQSAHSRLSEMRPTGCFDVLYFRATGNTEMIVCVCRGVVDWWLRNQQCWLPPAWLVSHAAH